MSQWGKTDTAADMPIWVAAMNKKKANTANRTAQFGNTSPNVTGVFVVNTAEAQGNPGIAHAGVITRKVGSGGRAGRVQTEVLIAASTYGATDAADDTQIPDAIVKFTAGSPANKSVATGAATTIAAAFTVSPSGVSVTHQWEISTNNGTSYSNVTNAGVYSGATTATLAISSATGLNGNRYRLVSTPLNGLAKTSRACILSVA